VDEAACSFLVKGRGIDGIDEPGRDDIEHLIQQAGALLALTLLDYEASGYQRNQDEAEEDAFS
jgi:hypothetical protein